MPGQFQQTRMKLNIVTAPPQNDLFHVVVKNRPWRAVELTERGDMTA